MGDEMVEPKKKSGKPKAPWVIVVTALGGILTGGAALWSAVTGQTFNEKMMESLANAVEPVAEEAKASREAIVLLRERVAVLEATCMQKAMAAGAADAGSGGGGGGADASVEAVGVYPRVGCESDNECQAGYDCVDGDCVKAKRPVRDKPDLAEAAFPKFDDMKQHVQQTGTAWQSKNLPFDRHPLPQPAPPAPAEGD